MYKSQTQLLIHEFQINAYNKNKCQKSMQDIYELHSQDIKLNNNQMNLFYACRYDFARYI